MSAREVRVRAVEYYPVFELEELKEDEKPDELCVRLPSREIDRMKRRHREWEDMQEKLRVMHPWF